jgi:hypothetical protein
LRALLTATLLLWPGLCWACSGPGAESAIQRATLLGVVGLVAQLGLALAASVMARRKGVVRHPVLAAWALVAMHPGIWSSARSGDCGQTREVGALPFLLAGLLVLGWAWARPAAPASAEGGGEGD